MVIIGVWWMLRELEMSSAQVHHLYLDSGLAHLLVPVHKSESAGNLLARALGCACKDTLARLCPWHCVERHLVRVYNHPCYKLQQHFPLFPDENGKTPSKQRMLAAFQSVIRAAGVELDRPDERGQLKPRFGGTRPFVFPALNFWPALVWQPNTSNFWAAGVQWQFRGTSSWPPCPSCQPCLRRCCRAIQMSCKPLGTWFDRAMLGAQQHESGRSLQALQPARTNRQQLHFLVKTSTQFSTESMSWSARSSHFRAQ